MSEDLKNRAIEAVARAICAECEENPDHKCDARGNEYRWQDYLGAAYAAVAASAKTVEQEPVAWMRFRAAQSWSGVGGHDVEHNEWLEACHAHEIGDDKLPAFPVYAAPQAPQAAPGWQPIETAPKDKSVLLLCARTTVPIYCGRKRYGNLGEPQQDVSAWRCDSSGRFASPTHWMPLPAAPEIAP